MSFMKRKKQPHLFQPEAWRAQKMPTQEQSVSASAPAPVVVSAAAKPAPRRKRAAKKVRH